MVLDAEVESNRAITSALGAIGLEDLLEDDEQDEDETAHPAGTTPAAGITAGEDESDEPPMDITMIDTHISLSEDHQSANADDDKQVEQELNHPRTE